MRISLYAIYFIACLLVCSVAILSAIVLVNTFNRQQKDSEDTQLKAGMGQVTAFQTIIANQMERMQTTTDGNARAFFLQTATLPDDAFAPDRVIDSVNDTLFKTWAPLIKAKNQLNCFGLTVVYSKNGTNYDRSIQAYWDLQLTGKYEYSYAFTSLSDGLCHAWRTVWRNYSSPMLVQDMYSFNQYAVVANTYMKDDFYDFPIPWSSSDGNSYFYFNHLRAFHQRGVWINFQTGDVGVSWLAMMRSVLTDNTNFIAFDSQKYVIAATNADEVQRLANCRGSHASGAAATSCISSAADQYPIEEIREVYVALYDPEWDDLSAGPIAPQMTSLFLKGKKYMVISGTLFSKNNFRTIIVWYQPWVTETGNIGTLTALICLLTVSTLVLTMLGIFGVLQPLTILGRAMRAVARTLKEGDGEARRVLEPRKPNVFVEVDEIGKNFETIMVDFLGFSKCNARDNRYAPKDTIKPFAVVFTDIQSSTALWGRDPVEMSRCLQAHHELIRESIREHRLYEVKTVGDSFMVTTSSAQDALLFALDVQTTLFENDWEWAGADDFYRETTLAFTKAASRDEYSKLWNGLRVRVGIHYGLGEVTYDEVSKGYDYYGPVVNAAARIEALGHGGQVVVSQAVLDALPGPLDPLVGVVNVLGIFPLRGVVLPPTLAEVKPTRLRDRTFPPLQVRTELEEAELGAVSTDDGDHAPCRRLTSNSSKDRDRSSSHGQGSLNAVCRLHQYAEELAQIHSMVRTGVLTSELVTQQLLTLYHLVEDLLKPLAATQRTTVVKVLAKGWGVPAPQAKGDFLSAVLRLVLRMSETTKALSSFSPQLDNSIIVPKFELYETESM